MSGPSFLMSQSGGDSLYLLSIIPLRCARRHVRSGARFIFKAFWVMITVKGVQLRSAADTPDMLPPPEEATEQKRGRLVLTIVTSEDTLH